MNLVCNDINESKTVGNDKPVMWVTVENGSDKYPRYMETIQWAIDYFLLYDADARFIATNAPGCSTLNNNRSLKQRNG